jgi:2-polyprenyl-6-methoxyphenol hydroxylase-like FAD-dependent oxidoreductase
MSEHFDAIIVGAGQAGPALAARLTLSGRKVAIVERNSLDGHDRSPFLIRVKDVILDLHDRMARETTIDSAGRIGRERIGG